MNKKEKTNVYLVTYEELERFDHMLTALAQAYWSLCTQRWIQVPHTQPDQKNSPEEENFYQLHLDLNNQIDQSEY